ncbi:hypothetical protein [Streptomyces sp. NPDC048248]|uniref:hypothetical protein n=1 Tax=Streptomyces sp. NPDC048248 TaxID=3365523 RepID=UPI00371C0D09
MSIPGWPPHANFHDGQYMLMTVLLGLIGLALALRQGRNTRGRLLCAAAALATPWLGMIGALLFPGTATYDPEFSDHTVFILGVHGQVFMAIIMTLALIGATAAARSGGCLPDGQSRAFKTDARDAAPSLCLLHADGTP